MPEPSLSELTELRSEVEVLRAKVLELESRLASCKSTNSEDTFRHLLELEYVFDAAPVGLVLLDRDLRYLLINERLAALNNKPVREHIGKTIREVIPYKADVVEPLFRRVLETGVPILNKEVALTSDDGEPRHFLASYYPVRTPDGQVIAVSAVVQDFTDIRRAERALRASENRYRFLAEGLPQFVWTMEIDGRIDYCNKYLRDYAGLSPDALNLADLFGVIHAGDLAKAIHARRRAISDRSGLELEVRVRRAADGEYRWFLVRVRLIPDSEGHLRWLATAIDIDDRKRAEETRRLMASIVESSSDAFIGLDHDGRITSWNRAAETLFGYSAAQVISRPVGMLNRNTTEEYTPEMMRVVSKGERIERRETMRTREGGELSVFISVTPIRDAAGNITGAFKTVRNLTEQQRVERELRAADERLHIAQRAAKAGVWDLDAETGAVTCSPELYELYGLNPTTVSSSEDPWVSFVHPDDREQVIRKTREALETGSEFRQEFRIIRDGEVRWLTAIGNVVEQNGSPRHMVGITIDTTDLRKVEEAVRQKARLESIGRLAGGIAHDFNNLLAGILGGASFLAEVLPKDQTVRPILDVIIRSSERASNLTKQLLAYAGKAAFTPRQVDLSQTVQEACSLLRGSIPSSVQLLVQTAWELPLIEVDPNQMREVVVNLVMNAAEAIEESAGTVCVRTGIEQLDRDEIRRRFAEAPISPGLHIYLEVQDTGAGMPPDVLRRIYEPFFTTKFTGRGLGLSAVEGIIRGHRGAIEAESAVGIGSRFRVYLPLAEVREAHAEASGAEIVLVIDDEEAVRQIVCAALERIGYKVLTASDGFSGIEVFRQWNTRISLVILDIGMAGLSGPEVHNEIRAIRAGVRVLVTSGYTRSEALARIPSDEVCGFLQKPFTIRELTALIRTVLGRQESVKMPPR